MEQEHSSICINSKILNKEYFLSARPAVPLRGWPGCLYSQTFHSSLLVIPLACQCSQQIRHCIPSLFTHFRYLLRKLVIIGSVWVCGSAKPFNVHLSFLLCLLGHVHIVLSTFTAPGLQGPSQQSLWKPPHIEPVLSSVPFYSFSISGRPCIAAAKSLQSCPTLCNPVESGNGEM